MADCKLSVILWMIDTDENKAEVYFICYELYNRSEWAIHTGLSDATSFCWLIYA